VPARIKGRIPTIFRSIRKKVWIALQTVERPDPETEGGTLVVMSIPVKIFTAGLSGPASIIKGPPRPALASAVGFPDESL
jgi:hypothetical protein